MYNRIWYTLNRNCIADSVTRLKETNATIEPYETFTDVRFLIYFKKKLFVPTPKKYWQNHLLFAL